MGIALGSSVPWHTRISRTLPLTETAMSTELAGSLEFASAGARVHGDWLADDEAIGNELADGLARVGVADLADLVGVEPDLALTAANDGGREALLSTEIDPAMKETQSASCS